MPDRYLLLQKKVEDLERVHNEGKKAQQAELDRLKQQLSRYQKKHGEQSDLIEKQRKQADLLQGRVQELKNTAVTDQAEIKELRTKLRSSEAGHLKAQYKQSETTEPRKSLQILEIKQRQELKERDLRISELEETISLERKSHGSISSKYWDLKTKLDSEAKYTLAAARGLEITVEKCSAEVFQTQKQLADVQVNAISREDGLLQQLEQHRLLLNRVSEEFATLASTTVSKSTHFDLRYHYAALQVRQLKLERKLANSEGQVVELVFLVRQVKEESLHLSRQLKDAHEEIAFYQTIDQSGLLNSKDFNTEETFDIRTELDIHRLEDAIIDQRSQQLTSTFYRLSFDELATACSVLCSNLERAEEAARQNASHLSSTLASHDAIADCLEKVQTDSHGLQEQLTSSIATVDALKSTINSLECHLIEKQVELQEVNGVHNAVIKKEKETVQHLTSTIQKSRIAEDALRHEIAELMADLTNAEEYQEAFYSLSNEVASLVTRNKIAEEEASQLSHFNAEILGHQNPGQRIMYVDRIRRELAETKLKVAQLTREQDDTASQNDELQHELNLYKSVMVPIANKPRTAITRISRPLPVTMTRSLNSTKPEQNSLPDGQKEFHHLHIPFPSPDDLIIAEIQH